MNTVVALMLLVAWTQVAQPVSEYNVPKNVSECWQAGKLQDDYEVDGRINPFYLRGDFNGDKNLDHAVLIRNKRTGERGILVCHSIAFLSHIVGAGTSFKRSDGYDYLDFHFDAWRVYPNRKVHQSLHEDAPPPKLRGEAILVEWEEAGSGLIYWDGKKYSWYHLGG